MERPRNFWLRTESIECLISDKALTTMPSNLPLQEHDLSMCKIDCTGLCNCVYLGTSCRAVLNIIPWLPGLTEFMLMEHTDFYPKFITHAALKTKEEQVLRLNILKSYASAFPSFLPGKYHRMDSVALTEIQAGLNKSYYWLNVAHFVSTISDRATIPFYNLMKGEKLDRGPKLVYEAIKNGAEFLLEPWVLIQLPFQPALLHQWAVAALAESLCYSKNLVALGTKGYLPQFHDLFTKLAKFSQTLTKNCNIFLSQFFLVYCNDIEQNTHVKAQKVLPEFSARLTETLVALEFILSEDCKNIFNFITQSSWSNNYHPEKLKFISDVNEIGSLNIQLEEQSTVYSDLCWFSAGSMSKLYKNVNFTGQTRLEVNAAASAVLQQHYFPCHHHKDACIRKRLTRSVEFILENDIKALYNVESFIDYLNTSDDYPRLEQEHSIIISNEALCSIMPTFQEGGIICQLMALQTDVYLEYSNSLLTRMVWLAAKKFESNVYLECKDKIDIPQGLSVENTMEITENAATQKEQWTLESILKKLETTCKASITDRKTKIASNIEVLNRKVQNLVLKMYKKQYKTLNDDPFISYPECPYVHYVLPCFIATYHEVEEDSNLDLDSKINYKRFVHELIKSYEEHEFTQELGPLKKMHYHNSITDPTGTYNTRFHKIFRLFKSIFGQSQTLWASNELFQHIGELSRSPLPKNHPKLKIFAPTESEIQISRLSHRIQVSLIKSKMPGIEIFEVRHQLDVLHALVLHKRSPSDADNILEMRLVSAEGGKCCAVCDKHEKRQLEALCKRNTSRVDASVIKDSKALTTPKLFGICLYQAWSHTRDKEKFYSTYQCPLFPLDPFNAVTTKLLERDWWGLLEIFAPLTKGADGEDLSRIPSRKVKKNALCRPLLKSLNGAGKLKMLYPGQVTFFPIRHCRWCGLVYSNKFKLCSECQDEPEYLDQNYFCSEECESSALESYHREDHAQFVMKQLGLSI